MSKQPAFRAFPKELFSFMEELSANNRREWFQENKDRYEQYVLQPSLEFIAAIQKPIIKVSPVITAVPKRVGGSLMRIYRDTRFSKDKTPFKSNVGIHFRHELGKDIHAPGLYVHLEPGNCFLGAGLWMPPSEPLAKIRQAIADNSKAWKRVREDKKFVAKFKFDGEPLKSAPRGYAKDHPMIEEIKSKSFAAMATIKQSELTSSACIATIVDYFRDSRPLMRFLCEALDLPW